MKRSVLDLIRADHTSVRRLLDLLHEASVGNADRREIVAQRLREVVAEHVAAEERTVYLTLAPDPDNEVAAAMHDHVVVRALLSELGQASSGTARWQECVAELRRLLERHMRREEMSVIPAMRNVPAEDLEALTERFMAGGGRRKLDG